jgi:hypothetical protein
METPQENRDFPVSLTWIQRLDCWPILDCRQQGESLIDKVPEGLSPTVTFNEFLPKGARSLLSASFDAPYIILQGK